MKGVIQQITDRAVWDSYIARVQPPSFLHTWEWGEFQTSLRNRILRIGMEENGTLCAVALLVTIRSKKGSFILCPHGPVFASSSEQEKKRLLESLLVFIKEHARKESCAYIRIAPLLFSPSSFEAVFRESGFRNAPIHVHPERAWILDIRPTEEELIRAMRKTTRYSIRKAEKDGVKITNTQDPRALQEFYALYLATVKRQHFVPFSFEYVEKELTVFNQAKEGSAQIFFAEYKGELLATAFAVFTPWSGFYHHGAASLAYPKISASYLLQYEIIREAKKRGCPYYNFWGIAHKNPQNFFDRAMHCIRPAHPWEGITLFKTGFGGFEENYIHAQDFVLSPQYWLTYTVESLRRIQRGL